MGNNTLSFFDTARKWLLFNYKTYLLAILVGIAGFQKYDLFYSSGIDESLPWVFNYFANGHFDLTQWLAFPHGRLAFLLYPLPMGNNLAWAIIITFTCTVWFCVNMLRLHALKHKGSYLAPALLLLVILSAADIQLLLTGLTFSHLLLYHLEGKKRNYLLAVFFAVSGFYIKSYCGIICTSIVGVEFLYMILKHKRYKDAALIAAAFPVFFFSGWLLLYGSLQGALTFFISQLELSSNNSEAVSLYNHHNWLFLTISLTSLLLLPLLTCDRTARHFYILVLPAIFAAWKHAMSRSDSIHLSAFSCFQVLLVFSCWLIAREVRLKTIAAGFISIICFIFSMSASGTLQIKDLILLKPGSLYNMIFKYAETAEEKNKLSDRKTAHLHLPDTVLNIIGRQTVDVYPWNYAIVAVNGLNWRPRPVIHSYAAYTGWLDGRDAEHIASANAPQFFIWEINKSQDSSIRKMEGIDTRYLLNDEPGMMLNFFGSYALRYKNTAYLLYEKREHALPFVTSAMSGEQTVMNDTWYAIPACESNCIMRARLTVQKSFTGMLKSFFYKGEGFFIHYQMEDDSIITHRIVPKNAAEGLWLYPLVLNPDNNLAEKLVKKIRIVCTDNRMVNEAYSVAFEQITFEGDSAGFLKSAFNKAVK